MSNLDSTAIPQKSLLIAIAVAAVVAVGCSPEPTPAPPKPKPVEVVIDEPTPVVDEIIEETPEPVQTEMPEPEPEPVAAPDPLPELSDSDTISQTKIRELLDPAQPLSLNNEFIRKLVLATDNLSRSELSYKYPPVDFPVSAFDKAVTKGPVINQQPSYVMNEATFSRYDRYINAFAAIDKSLLSKAYMWAQPLLNEAYGELGNPDLSFKQVTLKAIDNLVAAPDIDGDIALIRPTVMFKYADPALEKLSASDKFMLRIGSKNRSALKQALLEFKQELNK